MPRSEATDAHAIADGLGLTANTLKVILPAVRTLVRTEPPARICPTALSDASAQKERLEIGVRSKPFLLMALEGALPERTRAATTPLVKTPAPSSASAGPGTWAPPAS